MTNTRKPVAVEKQIAVTGLILSIWRGKIPKKLVSPPQRLPMGNEVKNIGFMRARGERWAYGQEASTVKAAQEASAEERGKVANAFRIAK